MRVFQGEAAGKKPGNVVGDVRGERLGGLRQGRAVTRGGLGELACLPHSHISEMERGVMLPNLVTILRLAAALPCKVSELTSVFDGADVASLLQR